MQLAFRFLISCRIFLCSLTLTLRYKKREEEEEKKKIMMKKK
jgi:hypothetical protein